MYFKLHGCNFYFFATQITFLNEESSGIGCMLYAIERKREGYF